MCFCIVLTTKFQYYFQEQNALNLTNIFNLDLHSITAAAVIEFHSFLSRISNILTHKFTIFKR